MVWTRRRLPGSLAAAPATRMLASSARPDQWWRRRRGRWRAARWDRGGGLRDGLRGRAARWDHGDAVARGDAVRRGRGRDRRDGRVPCDGEGAAGITRRTALIGWMQYIARQSHHRRRLGSHQIFFSQSFFLVVECRDEKQEGGTADPPQPSMPLSTEKMSCMFTM